MCGPVGARVAEYGNVSFYTRLGIRYSLFPEECRNSVAQANSKSEPRWPNPEFDEREHRARNKLVIIANLIPHRDPLESSESITVNSCFFLSSNYSHRVTGKKLAN